MCLVPWNEEEKRHRKDRHRWKNTFWWQRQTLKLCQERSMKISLSLLKKETLLTTPWFWTSSLQNCEKIHFYCFKWPSFGNLLWHIYKTNPLVYKMRLVIYLPEVIVRKTSVQFSSVAQSCPTLRPHELQHARPPCPSPTLGVYPNSCALSRWCHPTISFSVIPFSSCPQSLPESGSFPMSQLFAWGGQSIGVSASTSVFPMNTQDWSPLE